MLKFIIPLIAEIIGALKLKGSSAKEKANQYMVIGVGVALLALVITLAVVVNRAILISQEYKIVKQQLEDATTCPNTSGNRGSFDSGNGLEPKHYWDKLTSEVISCKDANCINKHLQKE